MGDVRHNIIYMLRTLLIENQKDGSLVSVTAKDGSFLAIGFRNNACEVTPEQSQDEKESTEEEIDIEGADHKSLEHLLGQDQCFSNNFNGVLGNKTKAFIFWLDSSCHENATYLSFSGGTPYGGRNRKSNMSLYGLGTGLNMFICIIFTIFLAYFVRRGRPITFNKCKSNDNERVSSGEHRDEQSRLVKERDGLEIQYSTEPPLPTMRMHVHRAYQESSHDSL